MAQPRSLAGLPAPLFEKLIDLTPNSGEDDQDLVFQTRDAATRSILREIARLIDTRLPWTEADEGARANSDATIDPDSTVMRFGVPDLTHLCIRNTADRRAIEQMVVEAIRRFEPRLIEPRVSIVMSAQADGGRLEVTGNVRLGRSLEPLAFDLDIDVRLEGETRNKLAAAAAKPVKPA